MSRFNKQLYLLAVLLIALRVVYCWNVSELGSGEDSHGAGSKRSLQAEKEEEDEASVPGELLGSKVSEEDEQEQGNRDLSNQSRLIPTTGATKDEDFNLTLSTFLAKYPVQQWKSLGLFDESYLRKINRFWLQFKPASTSSHYIMGTLYIIIMTVGCGGNLLVIVMFIRFSSLRTPANYLIVNLALSDFLMLAKSPVFIINSFYEGPVLGSVGCQLYGFVGGLTGTVSIMTLAVIAVDRYCVIANSMNFYKRTTRTRALLMILVVWIYSSIFASLPLSGVNDYVSEGYLTSCSFDYLKADIRSRAFIFIFFLAAWVVPLSLITFSYIAIFRIVFKAETADFFNGGASRDSFKYMSKIQEKVRQDVRIAMLTTFIVFIWVLAWTPYAIVALLGIFGQKELLTPFVSTLPAMFCKVSSCMNPFIYAISHPKFRNELRADFHRLCTFATVNMVPKCPAAMTSIAFDVSISEENLSFTVRKSVDKTKPTFTSFSTIVQTHNVQHDDRSTTGLSQSEEDETEFQNLVVVLQHEWAGDEEGRPKLTRTLSDSHILRDELLRKKAFEKESCCKSME